MQLQNVFTPITISGIEIKNRIRMSPMALGYAEDGRSTERYARFFEERAIGGVGLISWAMWPYRTEHGYFPWVYDDKFIPGIKLVADTVHKHGTKLVGQLGTGYAWAFKDGPVEIVGPSGVSLLSRPSTPYRVGTPTNRQRLMERILTTEEIEEMVDGYGQAAGRLKKAGLDGVELMLGAGYTLARFLSGETNKRTDKYGGDLDGRLTVHREIIAAIRKYAGDFPVFVKISGAQFTKNGYTLEECANEICPRLEAMGVCAIDVVVGWHEAPLGMMSNSVKPGQFLYLAEGVKKKAKVPVIGGDRTNDLRDAERAIAEGKIDMLTLGRQLLSDPETCNKAKEGRFDDIRPCMCCCWCLETVDTPSICGVNPRCGRELIYEKEAAPQPKQVVVVGGGPSGMEAAVGALQRGHKVTLLEAGPQVGGALELASIAPHKQDAKNLLDFYRAQMAKGNLEVKTGVAATAQNVLDLQPDAVIVATGATPFIPNVPGITRPNVILAKDVLTGNKKVGETVVVVGGGMVGCEVAEFLVPKAKKIIILEMLPRIAGDVTRPLRFDLIMRLRRAGIQMESDLQVTRISEYGVWGVRRSFTHGPNEDFYECDTVVIAAGFKAPSGLTEELTVKDPLLPVFNVGDSNKPGNLKDAILAGFLAAREV